MDDSPAYPYEFNQEVRTRARALSGRLLRLNLTSTASGGLLLIVLLFTGAAEWYGRRLGHAYWPLSVCVFTATIVSLFFAMELAFSYRRFMLRKAYGLSEQKRSRWLEDQAKGFIASLALAVAAAEFIFLLIIHDPGSWWLAAATAFILISFAYSRLFPLLLARFFYKIVPLPEGSAKDGLSGLLEKLGLREMQLYILNESSRSRSVNAFVTGIGAGRKVVLFDNLLRSFALPEVESIVAHELGHYVRRDTVISMVIGIATSYAAAVIIYATYLGVRGLGLTYANSDPSLLLWFTLVLGAFEFAVSPLMNGYSRRREARADLFSLDLTGDPVAFISGEKRLCDINLMEDDIGRLRKLLFATHPSTLERIRAGERWMDAHR